MNIRSTSLLPENPFVRPTFWGRQKEMRTIYKRLLSKSPQCCAVVGEIHFGKTSLLRHLADPQSAAVIEALGAQGTFTFVYLDCKLSIDQASDNNALDDRASAQFWHTLYRETQATLQPTELPTSVEPVSSSESTNIVSRDEIHDIKRALEALMHRNQPPIIFLLDNFEVVARLPLYNSDWLRSMVQANCAYVVASRHLLYLNYQYHWDNWANPSPLWNLFSDPIYLGLMSEDETYNYLLLARRQAKELGSSWTEQDLDFIRNFCGRHAELIRIACSHLFELRLQFSQTSATEREEFEKAFLETSITRDAYAICIQFWHGLADPELSDVPGVEEPSSKGREPAVLSPHQKEIMNVARENTPRDKLDKTILFVLEQRGLIERVNGEWRVFAEVFRQYILKQEQVYSLAKAKFPALTHLESKVYDYLKSHLGEVCDRDEIKAAVWEDNLPTNTALQKIIERIREKIELDPDHPRYLIAIRGHGYMLREDPLA